MARTDADSWDLSSSVGATATMVAAARALASREPDPLIVDPYAAPSVRAVGVDFFTRLVDGGLAVPDGDDGAWPVGTVVYEIDQPQVVGAKTAAMEALGATSTANRRTVAIDLRDDWPTALRNSGFDVNAPCAWSVEGLLMYLPPEAQDRLFDEMTALSAPGSRIATEFHGGELVATRAERARDIAGAWRGEGFDVDFTQLFYEGDRNVAVTAIRKDQ